MDNRLLRKIQRLGFSEKEFEKAKSELFKKNNSDFKDNDTIWSMCNSKVQELIKEGNYSDLRMLYYGMALFLAQEEGKNPYHLIQASNKTKLLELKEDGIKKVEVLYSGNGCKNCENLNGKIFDIDKALGTDTLPNKDCTFDTFNTGHPFCRCIYLPIYDDS